MKIYMNNTLIQLQILYPISMETMPKSCILNLLPAFKKPSSESNR